MNPNLPSLDQMTDILDIKPIIQVSLLWFWILCLLLILALAYGLYRFLKSGGPVKEKLAPEPLLSPREVALRDLEELDLSGILERGQYRKYYFRLSEILRLFLQHESALPAVDATTEEILPHLHRSAEFNSEEKAKVAQFLTDMDLVKFARFLPSGDEVKGLRAQLRAFIQTFHLSQKEPADVSS